jgi:hypothetical protein
MNTIEVNTKEQLDELENESALTIEGLAESSIPDFLNFLKENVGLKSETAYKISGEIMNYNYFLTGSNAYPPDLTIVSVKLSNIENVGKLITLRFQFGGRWFDDIVDNNRRRQEED